MIELNTNFIDAHRREGEAMVRFTVTGTDDSTGKSITSQQDYATVTAKATASNELLVALVEQSVEYARIAEVLRAQLVAARPLPGYGTPSAGQSQMISDADQRQLWVRSVDDLIASIAGQVTRFQLGYEKREAAALAYRDSGYTIDPTVWITRYADNNRLSYPEATTRILGQAAAYHVALEQLEAYRMDKYRIMRAPSREAAKIEYDEIVLGALAVQKGLP